MPSLSPPISVTFLGTGTSTGVPMIGCDCAVCTSSDPRDKRMRPSILVDVPAAASGAEGPAKRLLVDATPEMRIQMLRAGVGRIEAVLVTHTHADHIFGMDDIRQFNFRHGMDMPIYGTEPTLAHLRRVFDYCFQDTQAGGGKPRLVLTPFEPYVPFDLLGVTITPLIVLHGSLPVITFKFGDSFAYVTDVSKIPDETRPYLRGLDTLVVGTVRYEPHPTHFSMGEALAEIADLAPRQAFLTHLSHYFGHEKVNAELPEGVALACDGLTVRIPGAAAG